MSNQDPQPDDPTPNARSQITQFFGLSESEIDHQVEEHKYFLNLSIPYEITMEEAFHSWSQNVFSPLMTAIEEQGLEIEFSDLGKDELFVKVSAHWYFLKKQEDINISAKKAVLSFGSLFAANEMTRLDFYTRKLHL